MEVNMLRRVTFSPGLLWMDLADDANATSGSRETTVGDANYRS
jgi:hypothetical protein